MKRKVKKYNNGGNTDKNPYDWGAAGQGALSGAMTAGQATGYNPYAMAAGATIAPSFQLGKWSNNAEFFKNDKLNKAARFGLGSMNIAVRAGQIKGKIDDRKEEKRLAKEQEQQISEFDNRFEIYNKSKLATYPMQGTSGIDRFMDGGLLTDPESDPRTKYKRNKYGQYVDDSGQLIGYEKLNNDGSKTFIQIGGENPSFNVFNNAQKTEVPIKDNVQSFSEPSSYNTILPNMTKIKEAPRFDSKTRKVTNRKFYQDGGELSLNLQGGSAQKVSDNMMQFNGNTHEEGGIMIDPSSEVETGETMKDGQKIYSDNLYPSMGILKQLKDFSGVGLKSGTYADVSKQLGKKKAFYENLPISNGKEGNEKMLEKIEQATELLFQDQEVNKPIEENQDVQQFQDGGYRSKRRNMFENNYFNDYNSFKNNREKNLERIKGFNENSIIIKPKDKNFSFDQAQGNKVDVNSLSNNKKFNFNESNVDFGSLLGQGANYLNYLNNKKLINKLPTKIDPAFVDAPRFNYIDRSGADRAEVDTATSSTIKQLQRSTGQDINAGNLGAVMSANLQSKNRISQNEGLRQDAALQSYNGLVNQVGMQNAGIANVNRDNNTQLNIDRLQTELNNNNAFRQGVIANLQVAEANKMEGAKALLTAIANDNNGVVSRLLEQYPHLIKILKLQGYNG
jgi:hypothetical protein